MKYILYASIVISIIDLYVSYYVVNDCVINEGVAFGINLPYVELFSICIVLILFFISIKEKGSERYIFLSIGTLGLTNFTERIINNGVCDYISFLGLHMNLVDISISTIVLLSILNYIFRKNENKNR